MADIRIKTIGFKSIRQRLSSKKLGPLTKTAHKAMIVQWRNGAEAFVRAAVRRVLVDSGMSAASFFPLSRTIKRIKAIAAVRAQVAKGQISKKSNAALLPTGRRASFPPSVGAGQSLGEDAFRFTVGTPFRPVFTFQFSTVVFQHAFHEPRVNSLDAGRQAFLEYIRRNFLNLISQVLSDFLLLRPRTRRITEG